MIRLNKLVYLHKSPNLDIFICNFWFKPSSFRKLSVKCQTRPLIFHSTIFLSHKNSSFENSWWLHCMWFLVWPPLPIKNPGYAYAQGMRFRSVSPQITAWAPQARVNFCSSTRSENLWKLWSAIINRPMRLQLIICHKKELLSSVFL